MSYKICDKPLSCNKEEFKTFIVNLAKWSYLPTLYTPADGKYSNTLTGFLNMCSDDNFTNVLNTESCKIYVAYDNFGDKKLLLFRWYNSDEDRSYFQNALKEADKTVKETVVKFIRHMLHNKER